LFEGVGHWSDRRPIGVWSIILRFWILDFGFWIFGAGGGGLGWKGWAKLGLMFGHGVRVMQVKDLTTDALKVLIREAVVEALEDFLPDPDEGLTVKEEVMADLLAIRQRRAAGVHGISAEEALIRLGLGG
jgi:hypothetical protein